MTIILLFNVYPSTRINPVKCLRFWPKTFFILKFHETIIGSKYAEALCVFLIDQRRFGVLAQTGMTRPKRRVKFCVSLWPCFPPESGGRVRNSPLQKYRGMPVLVSAFLAVEFLTLLRINSVKYLRLRSSVLTLYWALWVWFWRDSAGQATLSRRCIGMKLLTGPAAVHYRLLVAK